MQKEIYVLINECLGEGRAVCSCVGSSEQHEAGQCGGEERRRNVCGPVADSYIRLALEYSAHPSCSPPLSFLHTPALNILLWKNPLRRYRPSPTPHAKNIQPRPPLQPPHPQARCSCRYDCCSSRLFMPCIQHQFIILQISL